MRENCFHLMMIEIGRIIRESIEQDALAGNLGDFESWERQRQYVTNAISTFLEDENNDPPLCHCTEEIMCGQHNDSFFHVFLYTFLGTAHDLKFEGYSDKFPGNEVPKLMKKVLMDKDDDMNHALLFNLDEVAEYELARWRERHPPCR